MQQFDWKRYFIFLVAAFLVFMAYDFFFAAKRAPAPANQTAKPAAEETAAEGVVSLYYLGSERERLKPEDLITVDTPYATIKVAREGAKIVSIYDKRFKKELIESYERDYNIYPLEILTYDWTTTRLLNFEPYECSLQNTTLECRLETETVKAYKRFTFDKNGYLTHLKVELEGVEGAHLYLGMTPDENAFYTHIGPIVKTAAGQVIRIDIEDIKTPKVLRGHFVWSGEEGRYFIKAANYETKKVIFYRVSYQNAEGDTKYTSAAAIEIAPSAEVKFLGGPKEYELLKELDFVEAIDFGVLKVIAYPTFLVLYFFYKLTHSWVAAIFILTLLIRIIFFPLSISSIRSMKKMQEIAPKIEEIRKKYSNDPQRMHQEIVKLYKETGFNPFGGCLPILIQIPIFFALYKVLIVTPDLALEGFLWIPSLAEKDPYYILPVIMGLTMVAQTWVTPSPNKQQNTLMYVMAAVFTFLFATFPSGLVLYWTLNNIFNLIQTWIIYKYLS